MVKDRIGIAARGVRRFLMDTRVWLVISILAYVGGLALCIATKRIGPAIVLLLLLQCVVAVGFSLVESRESGRSIFHRRSLLGIGAAFVAAALTGWLWWDQSRSTGEMARTLQEQSQAQKEVLDKTELVRTALDSSLSNLTQTRDMQEELTANLSVLADSLRIASGLIDSLRTASRTSLGTLQQLQFPVRIESVAWVDSGGHFPNELFRDICECYPHDVFPGNFVYDTVHENGIQPIYFWYVDTPDVRIGTPLKLERALSIPKGSDILSWLYNCESVDAVSRRAEYNIRQLEFSRDSELAAASVLRDSAQANRFDDPAWPQRARVEREREEVLRARQFFLDRLARCDDDRLAKWVLDYFHETVGNVTPADSLEFARTALRAQIRVLDGRVERMFAERDPQADQRLASRMLGAVRSLGFGNPGVRWLTFFAHLPQVNGTHKWSSDREAELVFMSGDLALYAKDEVMEYFYQPSGKFSYAKAGGAESLAGFYQELSRIPYPASLELNFATGEVYRHFEVDVQVVNSTGQFSSVCDLEGSWLAIPSWQLPVPLQLVFAFPDGKKLQVLGTEFKEGPYDWWWAQINRGHLSAFPLCRE